MGSKGAQNRTFFRCAFVFCSLRYWSVGTLLDLKQAKIKARARVLPPHKFTRICRIAPPSSVFSSLCSSVRTKGKFHSLSTIHIARAQILIAFILACVGGYSTTEDSSSDSEDLEKRKTEARLLEQGAKRRSSDRGDRRNRPHVDKKKCRQPMRLVRVRTELN